EPGSPLGVRLRRHDRDHPAGAAALELDRARGAGVDRVVLADADPVARLEAGAALAHDDLAAGHGLTGEHLHAKALGVRVAAVARGAEALLMRHCLPPSWAWWFAACEQPACAPRASSPVRPRASSPVRPRASSPVRPRASSP